MTETFTSRLYRGHVWHRRTEPKVHQFRYPVFYAFMDLDDFGQPETLPWCLSIDRFNLFSLRAQDYSAAPGQTLKDHVLALAPNSKTPPTKVMMLTLPRLLGYAFNPLTVFYCCTADGAITSVLYQVNNTFGERHTYRFAFDDGQAIPVHGTEKRMHVSPFFPVTGSYKFRQQMPGNSLNMMIDYRASDTQPSLKAGLTGTQQSLTAGNLLRLFFRIPFVTLQVIGGIHFEALRLWLKGVKLHRKPAPPIDLSTTIVPSPIRGK